MDKQFQPGGAITLLEHKCLAMPRGCFYLKALTYVSWGKYGQDAAFGNSQWLKDGLKLHFKI